MSLFAQHGYGKANKISKGIENCDISGVVLSPKSENPQKMIDFVNNIKTSYEEIKIFFDPQFFVGHLSEPVNSGKLSQYSYYENNLSRAKLSNPTNINIYSERVIDFQKGLGVSDCFSPSIIIPDFENMDCQIAISFAYASMNYVVDKNLYVSLYISETAFENTNAMEEFLNTISLLDVKGFYLVVERGLNTAKSTVFKKEILSNIMKFLYNLSIINQFKVIVGYSDIISVLLSAVCDADFACGWYSNLKQFSEYNFKPVTGGRRPRKRYTSTKLFGSLLLLPEIEALNRGNFADKILSGSNYDNLIYPNVKNDDWSDEISCLSNWSSINKMLNQVSRFTSISERLSYMYGEVNKAQHLYNQISQIIPQLDQKSNNSHLQIWKDAIELFREDLGV